MAIPTLKVRARPGYFAPKPPPVRPSIEFTLKDLTRELVDVTIDDLEVVEDGVAQKLEAFQEAVTPVSIVFALDASGSMKKATEDVKAAAKTFVQNVRPEDALALILFADKSHVRARHDHAARLERRGHRQVHRQRRHGAVRRASTTRSPGCAASRAGASSC